MENNKSNEQEIRLSDEQVVKAFLNNKEYRENHHKAAQQLSQVFKSNWFTADDLLKKTKIPDLDQALQLLTGLQLFGLCHSKQGGQLYKHKLKFQLLLTPQDKLKVLLEEKEQAEKQLSLINQEIEKVEEGIKQSSKIEE